MPKSLPKAALALWEKVYDKAKSDGDDEEVAAKKAYSAIKSAGWKKGEDGEWHKEAVLNELSLTIKKASLDPETGEKRWRAETSDTGKDVRGDNMTISLFNDFISRIESEEKVPYPYRSDYWSGGLPYVSISHYPDFGGDGVPGNTKAVYVDGSFLKAKGIFNDTPLGEACWQAICDDQKEKSEIEDKIRISIGFLDYAHKHKDSGYEFERKTLDDMCPECFMNMFMGDSDGVEFTKGHLMHLALTRVPANKRTDINPDLEVSKSMATQKDDAASIIGEEQAEELEKNQTKIPDAQVDSALVIKATEEETELVHEPDKEVENLKSQIDELTTKVEEFSVVDEPIEQHELDDVFAKFKSAYDQVNALETSTDEKLQAIQEPFNEFGTFMADTIRATAPADEVEAKAESDTMQLLNETLLQLSQKMDLILAQKSEYPQTDVPQRRSINPAEVAPQLAEMQPRKQLSIAEIAKRSVGLE